MITLCQGEVGEVAVIAQAKIPKNYSFWNHLAGCYRKVTT